MHIRSVDSFFLFFFFLPAPPPFPPQHGFTGSGKESLKHHFLVRNKMHKDCLYMLGDHISKSSSILDNLISYWSVVLFLDYVHVPELTCRHLFAHMYITIQCYLSVAHLKNSPIIMAVCSRTATEISVFHQLIPEQNISISRVEKLNW